MGYNDFMQEARSININGSVLKSIWFFFQECATYVHPSTLAHYVVTSSSFHHGFKEKIRRNSITDEQPQSSPFISSQKQVNETIINNSKE